MKLWLLTGNVIGYDTYDSVVVAAATEEEAKQISPAGEEKPWDRFTRNSWADSPKDVKARLIGTAVEGTKEGVILSSFNAG